MARPSFCFEGVVRVTKIGTAYLLFTLLLGFAALNTGNNSLYIALAMMLGTLLVSGVLSQRALRSIDVTFESADAAWAGAPVRGELTVVNRSRWLSPRELVLLSEVIEPVMLEELHRGESRRVPVTLAFARRGRASLSRVDLYCRYPFGLFLKKRSRPLEGEVIVYPRLLTASELPLVSPESSGATTSKERSGRGTELYGFRDYVEGDSLRQVNWKKSARVGRWILRQPQEEQEGVLKLAVDPWVPPGIDAEAVEPHISAAATLIRHSSGPVVLYLPGMVLDSRRGGTRPLLEALALLHVSRERLQLVVPVGARVFSAGNGDGHDSAVA